MKNVGYKALALEYDAFYSKKDYATEVDFISRFLKKKDVKTLLDIGCGTGTHLALLEKQGFNVSGLDLNGEMLEVAKSKVNGPLYEGDMTHFSLSTTFDAITCLFAAFNHNLNMKAAQQALRCFKQHLKPHGVILIDLYNAKDSGSKVDRGTELERSMKWTYDPEAQMTKTSVSYKTAQGDVFQDPFNLRHFSMSEMLTILQEANFSHIEFWDNFTERPATPSSKNLVVTAVLRSDF